MAHRRHDPDGHRGARHLRPAAVPPGPVPPAQGPARRASSVRPIIVTLIGYMVMLDAALNTFGWAIDLLANHTYVSRIFLPTWGNMFDAGYFWHYNELAVGGAGGAGREGVGGPRHLRRLPDAHRRLHRLPADEALGPPVDDRHLLDRDPHVGRLRRQHDHVRRHPLLRRGVPGHRVVALRHLLHHALRRRSRTCTRSTARSSRTERRRTTADEPTPTTPKPTTSRSAPRRQCEQDAHDDPTGLLRAPLRPRDRRRPDLPAAGHLVRRPGAVTRRGVQRAAEGHVLRRRPASARRHPLNSPPLRRTGRGRGPDHRPRTTGASSPSPATTRVDFRELVENKEQRRAPRPTTRTRRRVGEPAAMKQLTRPRRRRHRRRQRHRTGHRARARRPRVRRSPSSTSTPTGSAPPSRPSRPAAPRRSIHVADVSDADRMAELPDEVLAQHGACHILVNNAGVLTVGRFADDTLDNLRWIVGINVFGVVHGCHYFLPAAPRRRRSPHRERLEHGRLRRHPPERRLLAHQGRGPLLHRGAARRARRHRTSASARCSPAPSAPTSWTAARGAQAERLAAFGRTRIAPVPAAPTRGGRPPDRPSHRARQAPASCSDPTPAPSTSSPASCPGAPASSAGPSTSSPDRSCTCCESCSGPQATSAARPWPQSTSSGRRSPPAPAAIRLRPRWLPCKV